MSNLQSRAGQATPVAARPWEDYGFFGPGSPSWQVWSAPTALLGFQRSVVLEHFDPFLTAAVADMQGIYADPHGRLDRTLAYFLTVAVADGRTAIEASEILMRVHTMATGIEPISGKRYSANNPDAQLWIHVTGWHSVLKCYEMYGPGPLSAEQEQRYWDECVIAAELQTCKPADVPRSRDEVREYFAAVRPRLCTSERAHQGMHYLLRPPRTKVGYRLWALSKFIAPATVATLPSWMRELGGYDQPAAVDLAIRPAMRVAMRAAGFRTALTPLFGLIAPETARILGRHLRREVPAHPGTITPAQARERYGQDAPHRADTAATG